MSLSRSFPESLRALLALGLYLQLAGICFIADGSRYATITNLTLFAPALVALFFYRRLLPSFDKTALSVLMALCAWVAFVAVFNEGSVGAPWKWLRLLLNAGLYVLAIALVMQNKTLWRVLLLAVVYTAAFFAWLSLFQALLIDNLGFGFRAFRLDSWAGHKVADFENPIVSALYFGVVAIVALCLSLREKSGMRLLCLIAFLGASAYCYFTYSRGVWVGLLAAAITYLAVSLTARQFRMLLWGLAPFCIAGVFLLSSVGGIDASYRDEIFWQWLAKFRTFWLWGAGAGADPNICIEVIQRCFNQAHSLYLQFFYEYGLPGLLLLLLWIVTLLWGGWRYRLEQSSASLGLALMVFVLVVSIANYYVIFLRPGVFWIVFWLPAAILLYEGAGSCRSGAR
ncbi:O-antigen ligase domain-containing protein [Pseudomonas stutzeri]|uniref:O-antigen ligase family protein n=1 Tax=Stutzerimonas stutzeri TaxID=316 RepID=UPI000C9AF2E2|nr:O-antigen ligase family protein [Stutzerimonas stutzeri]MCQ4281325.1 O-antigen ligase domain-containing protein [Stutzerimonas stutzeri]PNF71745.1 polymerase [Stutzerimonas stutzeri]